MSAKHVILCGGATLSSRSKAWRQITPTPLSIGKGRNEVHLHLHDLTRSMMQTPQDVATDLLEIASYLFAADQVVRRGGEAEFEYGAKWRRHFWFEIPVRQPDLWSQPEVTDTLREVLTFLSDDDYEFNFKKLRNAPPIDNYLDFRKGGVDSSGIEEVMLFSGGLDSFGGAVKEIADGRRKVALVSHVPTSKVGAPQRTLVEALNTHLNGTAPAPFHVQIELNKGKSLGREHTQRTRSFVYSSLAAVVARMLDRDRIRFYENGIVSFNLPLSLQSIGARASRTTHPQSLSGFAKLFSKVFETNFTIENPFLWKTKTDILTELKAGGFGRLCAATISCAHTWERTTQHTHCGTCSQCIDRRLVASAAHMGPDEDPPEMYKNDLFEHQWLEPADATLIEGYLRTTKDILGLDDTTAFMARFGSMAQALRHTGTNPREVARSAYELHRRHARQIQEALAGAIRDRASGLLNHQVPTNSLLGIAIGLGATQTPTPTQSPPTPGPDAVRQSEELVDHPTADRDAFVFRYGSGECTLGNSVEFRFIERLCRSPEVYIDTGKLMEDVWEGRVVQKNTVAKTACNLRRKIREAGVSGVEIDGMQKDHYRLHLI